MLLTTAMKQVYAFPASPHCEVGIAVLREAAQPHTLRFFCVHCTASFYGGLCGAAARLAGASPVLQLRTVRLPMIAVVWRRVFNLIREAIMNTQPLIERRSFPPRPASLTDLPFVADVKTAPRKTELSFWHVPPTDDYGKANQVGIQYACDYMQYLKENPFWVGSGNLGWIVSDMAKSDVDDTKGYAVGFWSFVEQMLHFAATKLDHYAIAEERAKRYAAWKAEADKENGDD